MSYQIEVFDNHLILIETLDFINDKVQNQTFIELLEIFPETYFIKMLTTSKPSPNYEK